MLRGHRLRHNPLRAPALLLVVLAPFIGELLLGSTPLHLAIAYPALLPLQVALYGSGALLVRELTRRAGRGWPTLLLLALGYGLVEEGLGDMSLFDASYDARHLLGIASWLGVGWFWWLHVLTMHAVWSIGAAVALSETLVPERADEAWLSRAGLLACGAVFVLAAAATHAVAGRGYVLGAGQLTLVVLLIGAAACAAFAFPDRSQGVAERGHACADRGQPCTHRGRAWADRGQAWAGGSAAAGERPPPSPLSAGGFAFAASSAFMLVHPRFSGEQLPGGALVAADLALYALVIGAIWGWSRRRGWSRRHLRALAGGAVLTYAWYGFVLTSGNALDLVAQAIFAGLLAGVLALGTRLDRPTVGLVV